jgi:rhamnosyltransferase
MNIIAHICSTNRQTSVRRIIDALLKQTFPVREIVVVDNRSSDGTQFAEFPAKVTLICHLHNLGPGGAAATGIEYALANNYDWIWILDDDSVPRVDSLEKLVDLYQSVDSRARNTIGVLSCSQVLLPSSELYLGRLVTPGGLRIPKVDSRQANWECDITIWSGSLVRVDAVRATGLPRCGTKGYWEDFGFDYGDIEFFYRVRKAGFRILFDRSSILDHQLGETKQIRIFGHALLSTTNHSPERRYLYFRNLVYFWLYLYPQRNWFTLALWFGHRLTATMLRILLIEENSGHKLWACLRGVWDGSRRKLRTRYV